MVTYQLHVCDGYDWTCQVIIYASSQKEMDFCLKQLGFTVDKYGHYEMSKDKLSYWAEPYRTMHVSDLKGKL